MPYIGNSPANNVRGRFYYTATAAQTVFSGADSNGKTLAYQDGGYVDVYLNGVLLQDTTDYTATTKTSVTLTSGATAGDLVEIVAYGIFSVADSVSALSGGTFEGAVVVNNNFTVDNGTIKLDGNYPVGSSNVAIGDTALDDASFSGANNVAVGHAAMSSTTSGNFNSGVGAYSLNSNTTGSSNSSYGSSSLENNTTGSSNSAYGAGALNSNTTASNNTAVGYQAGYSNTTGAANTFVGFGSGRSSTGTNNTFYGKDSGFYVTSGSNNTILGRYDGNQNGLDIRTSTGNIVLSDGDGNPRLRIASSGAISFGSTNGSNDIEGGSVGLALNGSDGLQLLDSRSNSSINTYRYRFYNTNGLVGSITTNGSTTSYNTSSDYRLKENVVDLTGATDRLKQLEPKRFNFIADADTTVDGFIAHEVQAIVPEAITGTHNEVEVWKDGEELPDGVSVGDNKLDDDGNTIPKYQGIDQSKLVPLLVAAVKEQQATIEALEARIAALETP